VIDFIAILNASILHFERIYYYELKFTIKLKIPMNKLKANTSQSKIKMKIPSPSPTNKKFNSKLKDKIVSFNTPRNYRLHTLSIKKSIDINNVSKATLLKEFALPL